jgi:hypothetical protein
MRASLVKLGILGAFAMISGCAISATESLGTSMSAEGSDHFFTLEADGAGYRVRAANIDAPAAHATKLVFEGPGLDDGTVASIEEADVTELVLFGQLGPEDPSTGTRTLIASEVYRGMPGKPIATGDGLYAVQKRIPHIECFTTPCPQQVAVLLNATAREEIDRVSVERLAGGVLDESWLMKRIARDGALVAGHVNDPHPPPRFEKLLLSSQVFVRLPERRGPCADIRVPRCNAGTATFYRTADRCLVFDRCVDPGICPRLRPLCPAGYTAISWAMAPDGCPEMVCDPLFATQ